MDSEEQAAEFGAEIIAIPIAGVGPGCNQVIPNSLAPVAAYHDGSTLTGLVAAEDGSWLERRTGEDALALGRELARLAER